MKKISLIHGARSQTQPDIWLVESEGKRLALRDYSKPRNPIARLLCRWAVRREIKAHRLLDGVKGIPRIQRVIDRDRYLMDFIEGEPLSELGESANPELFEVLERIVSGMHDRGVAHGDLRNKNILIDGDSNPYLIDLTTAWWETPLWRKPLFNFYKRLDWRRLAKSKAKFLPETLTPQERDLLEQTVWLQRIGRWYRHRIYPIWKSKSKKKAEDGESSIV